jgi:hypothetical protein
MNYFNFFLADSQIRDVLVCCFTHCSLSKKIQDKLQASNSHIEMKFNDTHDVLGCQFASLLLILDLSTCNPNVAQITDALTRATTSVHCIINKTMVPFKSNSLV